MRTLTTAAMGDSIEDAWTELCHLLLTKGERVDTGHWQAIKDVPNTKTIELQNVVIEMPISPTPGSWASYLEPNLPWAEDHFQERVSGEPSNPGVEYKNWPWYRPTWEAQKCCSKPDMKISAHIAQCHNCGETWTERKFSHTYQERIWPRWAPEGEARPAPSAPSLSGIRYRYGDLNDVVALLAREPYTRQAFLPIWFPEDTGAHQDQRVPCTLGYHLMLRDDYLHCFYPIRSLDLFRYFRDDAYMAGRLVQWVIEELAPRKGQHDERDWNNTESVWATVLPGKLTMHIPSLHVFQGEEPRLRREARRP